MLSENFLLIPERLLERLLDLVNLLLLRIYLVREVFESLVHLFWLALPLRFVFFQAFSQRLQTRDYLFVQEIRVFDMLLERMKRFVNLFLQTLAKQSKDWSINKRLTILPWKRCDGWTNRSLSCRCSSSLLKPKYKVNKVDYMTQITPSGNVIE